MHPLSRRETDEKQPTDGKHLDEGRRAALRRLTLGGGSLTALGTIPRSWITPVVDAVFLPAHAQASVQPLSCGVIPLQVLTGTCGASRSSARYWRIVTTGSSCSVTEIGPTTFLDGDIVTVLEHNAPLMQVRALVGIYDTFHTSFVTETFDFRLDCGASVDESPSEQRGGVVVSGPVTIVPGYEATLGPLTVERLP